MNDEKLERVIFQFSEKCNMSCTFCYCPFTGEKLNKNLCFDIIDYCSKLGVKTITFGGGDPFLCTFIEDLIIHTNQKGIEIHIDTNGLSLSNDNFSFLEKYVSMISFPIDGVNKDIHKLMRGSSIHYDIVMTHLKQIKNTGNKIKINTVVSSINSEKLHDLVPIFNDLGIYAWNLQQFFPIDKALNHIGKYYIDNEKYNSVIEKIKEKSPLFIVENGLIQDRIGNHFFVTHSGNVYVHSKHDRTKYLNIGSIFDSKTIETWKLLSYTSIHPATSHRYKFIKIATNE